MSMKIYRAISENFIRQMRNWALTTAGVVPNSCRISSCYRGGARDTYGDAREPILIGEAEDVNTALNQLPLRYRQAVSLFWQYEGRPMIWLAGRCGRIDWRTYESRVLHGHELLVAEIGRHSEKVNRYRQAALGLLAT